jgi:hypothetical protein
MNKVPNIYLTNYKSIIMKKVFLIFLTLIPLILSAQIEGDFYKGVADNGYYYYFQGKNTTSKTISITIWAINDPLDQVKQWKIILKPKQYFTIGPQQGWLWQNKERLEIQFSDGSMKRWKYLK